MDLFCALNNFIRVVETGSFSRVARELDLSHTAVTRQVAQLEQHFGVRLLHRTTRRLSLTEDGEILVNYARRLLDESSAMEKELGTHRNAPSGLVRLGTIMGAGLSLATDLPQLLSNHPGLSVELVVCDHINEMVESRLDLAICDGEIADSSFIARQIAPLGYAIVAAPHYLERHGAPSAPAELERHTCIVQDTDNRRGFWQFNGPEGPISVPVSGQLITNNERAALVMARSGYGIAYLPDAQVREDVLAGRLIRLMPHFEPKPSMLYVVYPSRRQLAPRTRVVLEFLIQQGRLARNATGWELPAPPRPCDGVPITSIATKAVTGSRSTAIN
ncbi:MAG TPA: LysR family transcriptional regulator [Acetobacteraceae bacterium]|nr:LysR family transcriptional regulator [Acetobacteraceae bacterium]